MWASSGTPVGFVHVFPARNLPALGAGADLAACRLRRRHCRFVFFNPVRAGHHRFEAARFSVRLGRMVVRGLHHGVRPHPCVFDLYAVGAGLRHRRHRQGHHRDGVCYYRAGALAADSEDHRHSIVGPASSGLCCARGRRQAAARRRDAAAALPRNRGDGNADQTGPEDGGGRPADRRHRARLQQHSHRDHGNDRNPGRCSRRPARTGRNCKADRRCRHPRSRPDPAFAGLRPQAAAATGQCRYQRADRRYRAASQTRDRRTRQHRFPAGGKCFAGAGRSEPAGDGYSQSGAERARCDAERRPAPHRNHQRRIAG